MIFHTPVYSAPQLGGPRWNVAIPVGMEKIEWWGYPTVKKNFEDMRNRLHTIPACDGRADGRTDRQSCHVMHTRRAVKMYHM